MMNRPPVRSSDVRLLVAGTVLLAGAACASPMDEHPTSESGACDARLALSVTVVDAEGASMTREVQDGEETIISPSERSVSFVPPPDTQAIQIMLSGSGDRFASDVIHVLDDFTPGQRQPVVVNTAGLLAGDRIVYVTCPHA